MELLANLALGLETAITPWNLFYCFAGVFLGTFIGVIPGVGPLAAISMLFPITFYLDPTSALIMLAGIYYGTTYGGSTASILLNIPGATSAAVTCLDGYPMAQQGRAGVALFMTTIASFVGGSIGIIILSLFSPLIAEYALRFGPADYFALMVLGLVAASTITNASPSKGLSMVVLGMLIATVGIDSQSGAARYTFGSMSLLDGFGIAALAMGLFGVGEILTSVGATRDARIDSSSAKLRNMIPTREDWRRSWKPGLRGSAIGSFFGALPGTGPSIASFMAYAVERRVSSTPERFGNGAIEGVVAPESANNAADQTAFIPTLTLGIPGSATMALMLGALMVHGIQPGPTLISQQPSLFWGLVMSFWIGNLLLVVLNLPLIGLWVRLLLVPYHYLYPAILVFVCIGAYSVRANPADVLMVLGFGVLGYVMRLAALPAAPLLLGFVLGPLVETQFRRAMVLARGDFTAILERPLAGTVLALAALLLAWTLYVAGRDFRRKARDRRSSRSGLG
ncbi:tripartite tricarboxylate transporter permease [Roseinatronobacter alkalisoli]|uniref:Tripartite tricarboxylate transporter permease n=1 Tax=Roseinatronobacter alkalisoli TaxID=3028235 RepID=A0ABT5TDC4_9RHOB|nr:tripartite tricarboxylate transporter permease [Roseinatronobacter sp. HJB301]MDD7973122.1 tripartite tricarboxylate transporter permease [Roseinatronobacter sp. HJB301]